MPKQAQLKKNNEDIFLNIYKIGDIYITTNSENPADRFGGKWELFGPGRCLVCVDTSQTEFNSVKKTGGEKTHKLTINEMPSHSHRFKAWAWSYTRSGAANYCADQSMQHDNFEDNGSHIANTGGGQAHNNLQPFITCYVWRRIA